MVSQLWIVLRFIIVLKQTHFKQLLDLKEIQEALVLSQIHQFIMVLAGVYKLKVLKIYI
jgi:hypothetical protein